MNPFRLIVACLALPLALTAQVYEVGLVAGNPSQSGSITDGTINPSVARFSAPVGISVNTAGRLFVVDTSSTGVRMVNLVGDGTVSTLATGFSAPQGVVVGAAGSIFVADTLHHQVRKILSDDANPPVTIIAGTGFAGNADNPAEFDSLRGIAISPSNPVVAFICDTNNHTIRKLNVQTGEVTTLAGQAGVSGSKDGTGATARFNFPSALAVTSAEVIYVADTGNHVIRRITSAGVVTTLAGEIGISGFRDKLLSSTSQARFNSPWGLVLDSTGNLIVCDSGNHVIRKVTTAGAVSTIAGKQNTAGFKNATSGRQALFNTPKGICRGQIGSSEIFFVTDTGNKCIRSINQTIPGPTITAHPIGQTIALNGLATFKVTATRPANTLPLSYQWRKDGVDIPGETASTLTISNVQPEDQGAYSVIVAVPGGEALVSHAAPLVIKGQQTWLWTSRFGTTSPDAVQGLDLLQTTSKTALWASGLAGGHALKRLSPITGLPASSVVISSKGDGAHDLAADADGGVFGGMDRGVLQDTFGHVTKHSSTGTKVWGMDLGRRVVPTTTTAVTDVFAVVIDTNKQLRIGGDFSGNVSFPSRKVQSGVDPVKLGSASRSRRSGLVGRIDPDGDVEWMRELYGTAADRGDSRIYGLVCAADGSVYACGRIGPGGRVMRSADTADLEVLTNTAASCPIVVKYNANGAFQWAHVVDSDGEYFSIALDTDNNPWVTGHQTSPLTAVLRELNPITGIVESGILAANGRGTSVTFHATNGIAWLIADPAGQLEVLDRSFPGVSGYRVVRLDAMTLAPEWDLPVFGSLAAMPASDQADIIYATDGRLYASLNFIEEDRPRPVVDFVGRGQLSMTGRKQDGLVAVIGEIPEFGSQPSSLLLPTGGTATFSSTSMGEIIPTFQWYKGSTALPGKTSGTLTLSNVKLTDAGSYLVKLKNGRDTVISNTVQLGLVDSTPKAITKAAGSTATISAVTAGSGLSYAWFNGANPVTDVPGRISGSSGRVLVIKNLSAMDAGAYRCVVSSIHAPGSTVDSGIMTLTVTP
ncbi:MAG: immunoglobulin domain-containing protein [Verrucomicrobiaceae bacterium]|nr:immunoglobulin domain-containing protein [Verrucomicrobiaceae bacterium]